MGALYQSLLFYCNSRWLSRRNVVTRVVNNLREVSLFLEEENLEQEEHFRNEHFVSLLA
jgi:hypothetical protein